MRKRKLSERLVQEINDLKSSREIIEDFLYNFVSNSARYVIFMHDILAKKHSEDYLNVPISQYIVSLVTCWETYFRDMFVFLSKADEQFLNDVISMNNIVVKEHEFIREDFSLAEFISKFFNFQNLNNTEKAFRPLFEGESFFIVLNHYERQFFLPNKGIIHDFSLRKIDSNWYELIDNFFEIRHRIIHDANYRLKIKNSIIIKTESIFYSSSNCRAIYFRKIWY